MCRKGPPTTGVRSASAKAPASASATIITRMKATTPERIPQAIPRSSEIAMTIIIPRCSANQREFEHEYFNVSASPFSAQARFLSCCSAAVAKAEDE
jgi:hypothetical protein